MKKKALILFLATITSTTLLFTGCKNKEAETTPVADEAIEEIETTEPEEIEPVEEETLDEANKQVGSDIKVDEEIIEEIVLTQAELDELSKNAITDKQKKIVNSYKEITENGSWTSENGVTYTKVVGKPDGSWRKMSDAEAEKILATADPYSEEYALANAELMGKDFAKFDTTTGIVYYDPYEYLPISMQRVQESIEASGDTTIYTEEDLQKQIDEYWNNN